ncbi:major facilitator superfamily domain-containing protein [Naematelia encephala]|uniref:Major facilitator superfamily domain-containing protein n=1 Tax=Naematelia encephala TaxID=71784 RepID=A0A1Y2BKI9_9TREE|nr:major facilitator superfamily domain-containing protein [Naematelia encephala]
MTTQTLGKDNLSNTPDIDGEKNLGGLGGLSGLENTPELNGVAGDLVQDPDLEARRQFTYEAGEKLKRRVDWHLLPLLILAYLVKNMDGNVVSYVKVMNSGKSTNVLKELDISTDQWADMSTIFTVFFFIFEIPSNLIIKWSTPRLHFVRIMGSWSIVVACTAAVKSMGGLFACRALLGAFEAGLYPGILYQLACWYRPDEIAIRMSALGLLGQFSGIIDALLAFAYIDGKGGLSGWRWCYLILGLLGFVVTLLIFLFLPDWPDSPPSRRQFLTPEEGTFFAARLPPNSARSTDLNFDWGAIKKELKSPILYGFALIQMLFASGVTGLSFWLPTVIAGFGLTSTANSQLLNIPPALPTATPRR